MRIRTLSAVLLAVVLPISSCSENGLLDPASAPAPLFNHTGSAAKMVISQVYGGGGNSGAPLKNDYVELFNAGTATATLTGWSVQYASNTGTFSSVTALSGTVAPGQYYLVQLAAGANAAAPALPTPDAIGTTTMSATTGKVALVDQAAALGCSNGCSAAQLARIVDLVGYGTGTGGANFYEGTAPAPTLSNTTAAHRKGNGCTDNGQNGTDFTTGQPAPRNSTATPAPCGGVIVPPPPPPPVTVPATRFSEIHYDNFDTDFAEALEIEGPAGTDVTGWSIVLYNGNGGATYGQSRVLTGAIPASPSCNGRGVLHFEYWEDGLQNGGPDGIALVDAAGSVVEFLSYEGTFTATSGPAAGKLSTDIGASQTGAPVAQSLQRSADGATWASTSVTIGACNGSGAALPNRMTFSGRAPNDPFLPVGFEDQIFATLRNGATLARIDTEITWLSLTPAVASVDDDGVMRALSAGTATLRATTAAGLTDTYSLSTHVATASASADYEGNAEFGEPTDAVPTDDIIIRRNQLITSFNAAKGTPNWVAYEIDASHFGSQDRCECYTYDSELPVANRYTTADYTDASRIHGFGIDRGHMAKSGDRTTGSLDNAVTYYFSNIIPQASDNNQGPWSALETYLSDRARSTTNPKEVYVLAGPAGNGGPLKGEDKIVLPTHTWKVAVIMPKDQGIESFNSFDDLENIEVIAVIMPNIEGIRGVSWTTYKTTVDEVEALTGYNLLHLLRDDIEIAVESNTKPPVARVDGPYTALQGESILMSAASSSDPDEDALTYAWTFGDGSSATGENVSHTYTSGGTFTVRLIATDTRALADTVETTAAIATWSQATGSAGTIIGQLAAAGKLNRGIANSLQVKLNAAEASFARGNTATAINQLEAFLHELDALMQSGRLSEADAAQVHALVTRIVAAAS